jgi:hypothetical protein
MDLTFRLTDIQTSNCRLFVFITLRIAFPANSFIVRATRIVRACGFSPAASVRLCLSGANLPFVFMLLQIPFPVCRRHHALFAWTYKSIFPQVLCIQIHTKPWGCGALSRLTSPRVTDYVSSRQPGGPVRGAGRRRSPGGRSGQARRCLPSSSSRSMDALRPPMPVLPLSSDAHRATRRVLAGLQVAACLL